MSAHPDHDACSRLAGTRVTFRSADPESDGGWWWAPAPDGGSQHVAGLMGCAVSGRNTSPWIQVLGDDFTTNALAHEQVHVLECPAPDETHATWADAGYWDVVSIVSRSVSL